MEETSVWYTGIREIGQRSTVWDDALQGFCKEFDIELRKSTSY